MTRQKLPKKVTPTTTTTDLRAGDSDRIHAEIRVFTDRISQLSLKDPGKAAVLLADWIARESRTKKTKS